ncbi:MAG: 1,4-beta-D-glucan glucohydrolase [Gammaproteobacteria bacterium]|nr:1,4-beta-D-glucan glucohydrolase [Gammaproteobacteria bacterium]
MITLLGESTVEVDQNASYTDAGATATDAVDGDNIDGDVELVKTGSVDTTAAGTYTITYTATDTSNNSASVSRTINVESSSFWPKITSDVNTDVDSRILDILSRMTLQEKIGQMVQAEIGSASAIDVRQYNLGSVLNGGGSWPNGKQSSIADWVSMADDYYAASIDSSDGGVGIPIIWGTDAVHGHNNVIGATIFPHNIGLGATRDIELIKEIAEITALEVAVTGIDWVFSPVAAVVRNDRWGRSYEGFSEDPQIVSEYMTAMVKGLQGESETSSLFSASKVVATAKHFIGDGGTTDGVDQGDTEVSESELRDIHGQGYIAALRAGVQTIMATYNSWNGDKVHGNNYLLTDVLKEQMGFDGFVIGDWNGHGQVSGCSDDQCAQAINAGVDMIMVPNSWRAFIENTINQVGSGQIEMSRINDAVTRILRVKARSGLLDSVRPSDREYAESLNVLGSQEHRAVAREAVRKSIVLLKNKNSILPLERGQSVLIAGGGANDIGQQSGGWTVTWQGTGNSNADFPGGTSIYDGISQAVAEGGGTSRLSVDGSYSGAKPDIAIVVFGESPYAEGAGDISTLEYQAGSKSDLSLLRSLQDQDIPVVSVFLSGRPLWVNAEINASDAFIAAWLPGSEGIGVADVIFQNNEGSTNFDFDGRLSFSWPNTPTQFSLNRFDNDYEPLFAYGFGLTYSDQDTLGDDLDESGSSTGGEIVINSIPGLVQAEDYSDMFGIQIENTTDNGGGSNVGYIESGDWIEYLIDVGDSGDYFVEYRLASLNGSTGFEVLVDNEKLDTQTVPSTGGWQNWVTESSTLTLDAGQQVLRINALGPSWNINWLRFTRI